MSSYCKLKYYSSDVFSKCVTSKILKMLSEDNDDYTTFKSIINDNI